jgi:hypothetical protein
MSNMITPPGVTKTSSSIPCGPAPELAAPVEMFTQPWRDYSRRRFRRALTRRHDACSFGRRILTFKSSVPAHRSRIVDFKRGA